MSDCVEGERLRSLRSYGVLDTLPEEAFDRLTSLAAELFDSPIALVSLIDEQRQWFKSHHGLDATSTPREWSFCAHAIKQSPGTTFVVEDASVDPRFSANPLVTGDPNIRFYAGVVLTGSDGHNLGTLCIIDREPRPTPTANELERLQTLSKVVVDQLELQRSRRKIDEKNALLQMAERMSGLGRWRFDVADAKISWSDEVFRIHGLPVGANEPDFESLLALYHDEDRDILAGLVDRALTTGQGYELEARVRRPNGEVRNVTTKAECILDEAGAIQSLIGVFQDATDQVDAARFVRAVTDSVPGMIGYWDNDLRCRFANAAYLDWFGRSSEQMLGITMQDLMGERLFAENEPFIRAAMRGEHQNFERTLTKPSGVIGHTSANYIPDVDDAGRVRGMFVQVTDVTALKEAGLRLELTNQLLEEARDRAETATAVKSEFLANMSHEIRTPLTSILGFTNLLKERADLDVSARTQISSVAGASQALLSIVNDILDFSKLEAGHVKIKPQPVALSAMLRDALLLFSPMAQAKGLGLEFVAAGLLPEGVSIDPDKTRQILINLIGNAVKFTDSGVVKLVATYDRAAERLNIDIEDTGAGMTPEQQSVLFQRFSQVDGSSTRSHGGTGLGLAICKGLSVAMGGDIGVRSSVGKGTTFFFHIAAPITKLADARSETTSSSAAPLEDLRVLVVDDNPSNRELARIILEGLGAIVTDAEDGFVGLQAARTEPVDVILLDLRMPRLSGPEVLMRLRSEDGPNQNVPVVAFTAGSDIDRLDDAHSFNGLVHKPIAPLELIETIISSVNGHNRLSM
ncbi:MAG: ATP-binding protein [Phenylobacterium sp.]|nr:ATP-binding protein [Phenylobacterium sp.]